MSEADPVRDQACDTAASIVAEHLRRVFTTAMHDVRPATIVDRPGNVQDALPSWPVFIISRDTGRVSVTAWTDARDERESMYDATKKLVKFALLVESERVLPLGYTIEAKVHRMPDEIGLYGFELEIFVRRATDADREEA